MAGRKKRVGPVNYYELPRKQLQSLCKKYGFPANKTNILMAEFLTAHLNSDEYLNRDKSLPSPAVKTIFQEHDTEHTTEDSLPSISESQPTDSGMQARNLSRVFVSDDAAKCDSTLVTSGAEETYLAEEAQLIRREESAGSGPLKELSSFAASGSGARDSSPECQGGSDQETSLALSTPEELKTVNPAGSRTRDPSPESHRRSGMLPFSTSKLVDSAVPGSTTQDSCSKLNQETPLSFSTSEIRDSPTASSNNQGSLTLDQETPLPSSTAKVMNSTLAGFKTEDPCLGSDHETPLPLSVMPYLCLVTPPEGHAFFNREVQLFVDLKNEIVNNGDSQQAVIAPSTSLADKKQDDMGSYKSLQGPEKILPPVDNQPETGFDRWIPAVPQEEVEMTNVVSQVPTASFSARKTTDAPLKSAVFTPKCRSSMKVSYRSPLVFPSPRSINRLGLDSERSTIVEEWSVDNYMETSEAIDMISNFSDEEKGVNDALVLTKLDENSSAQEQLKYKTRTQQCAADMESPPEGIVENVLKIYEGDRQSRGLQSRKDSYKSSPFVKSSRVAAELERVSKLGQARRVGILALKRSMGVGSFFAGPEGDERNSGDDAGSGPEPVNVERTSRGDATCSDFVSGTPTEVVMGEANSSDTIVEASHPVVSGPDDVERMSRDHAGSGLVSPEPENIEKICGDVASCGPVAGSPTEEVVTCGTKLPDPTVESSDPVVSEPEDVEKIPRNDVGSCPVSGPEPEDVEMISRHDASSGGTSELPSEAVVVGDASSNDASVEAAHSAVIKVDGISETEILPNENLAVPFPALPKSGPLGIENGEFQNEIVLGEVSATSSESPTDVVMGDGDSIDASVEASTPVVIRIDGISETEILPSENLAVVFPALSTSAADRVVVGNGEFQKEFVSGEVSTPSIEGPAEMESMILGIDTGSVSGQQQEANNKAANVPAIVEESVPNPSWMTKPTQLPTRRPTHHKLKEKTGRSFSSNGRKFELMERAAGKVAKLKMSKRSAPAKEEEGTSRPNTTISAEPKHDELDGKVTMIEEAAQKKSTATFSPLGMDMIKPVEETPRAPSAIVLSLLESVDVTMSMESPFADNSKEISSLVDSNLSVTDETAVETFSKSLIHTANMSTAAHEEELTSQGRQDGIHLVCTEENAAQKSPAPPCLPNTDFLQIREEKVVETPPPKKVLSLLDIDFAKVREKPAAEKLPALNRIDSNRWAADTVIESYPNPTTPTKAPVQDVLCESEGKENLACGFVTYGKENDWVKRQEQHKTPLTGRSKEKALRTAEKKAATLREQLLRKRRGMEPNVDGSDAPELQSIQLSPLRQRAMNRFL